MQGKKAFLLEVLFLILVLSVFLVALNVAPCG